MTVVVPGCPASVYTMATVAAQADATYFLISTVIGLSLSLTRITTVLDILSVALRPKCGVLGGV